MSSASWSRLSRGSRGPSAAAAESWALVNSWRWIAYTDWVVFETTTKTMLSSYWHSFIVLLPGKSRKVCFSHPSLVRKHLCHKAEDFKMLRILLWITILVPLVATSTNFWGDEVTPRLRVNYLSQANGKHFSHTFSAFLLLFLSIYWVCYKSWKWKQKGSKWTLLSLWPFT